MISFRYLFIDMSPSLMFSFPNAILGRNVSRSSISDDNSPTNDTKYFSEYTNRTR